VRRFLDFLYDAAGYLAAFFILAVFVVMIGGTVMRELGMKTGGQDDIVAWFSAAAAFLAMAHTFRHGDFVRVTLLLEGLGPRIRRAFEIGTLSVATAFTGYLAFWAIRFVFESWQFGEMPTGLIAIPTWIPQLSFVVGAALLLAAVVDELVRVLRGEQPTYVVAAEERHRRGDYSEDL
jgi:TRAP-type C4-dicarboxylate transport system permease small subunit